MKWHGLELVLTFARDGCASFSHHVLTRTDKNVYRTQQGMPHLSDMEVVMSVKESWKSWWQASDAEQSAHLDRISLGHARWPIVLASAAALYIEMVMVRW